MAGRQGGMRVFGSKQISRIMFPARAMTGRQGAVDFGDIQIIATFGSLSLKQLNHMKKDIEIGEYAAPECVVVPVMMKETVLAVSGGQLDEEEEPVF